MFSFIRSIFLVAVWQYTVGGEKYRTFKESLREESGSGGCGA